MSSRCLALGLLLVVAFLAASCSPPPRSVKKSGPIVTTVCELSRHPDWYYGKLVQIRARVSTGKERPTLHDVRCVPERIAFGDRSSPNAAALEHAIEKFPSMLSATLIGTLSRPNKASRLRPVFNIQSVGDVRAKTGLACPWITPPLPPKRKHGESRSHHQRTLLAARHTDPCAPDNWLRTHPGRIE